MEKPETLGAFLRQRRVALDLTLQQVGDKVGTSKSYIWGLEHSSHRPGIDIAGLLAEVLKFPMTAYVDYLIRDLAEEPRQPGVERRLGERRDLTSAGRRYQALPRLPAGVERRKPEIIGFVGRRCTTVKRRRS